MTAQSRQENPQDATPLADAVMAYARSTMGRYHVPGHKGHGTSPQADALFGSALWHDLTELPGLDDLGAASGVISEAQRLAALAYGADRTYFLVGGASAGIVGAIWAAIGEGQTLALPRNAHRSAVSGLILSGGRPRWIVPPVVGQIAAYGPLNANAAQVPGADALLVISPTYEGLCAEFGAVQMPVIVDEAHGSHLYFCKGLPAGALTHRVAACIHGAHKTLGSLTGTGFLHLKGSEVDYGRIEACLGAVQTSSPSYLMMASLDIARRDMVIHGAAKLARVVDRMAGLRQTLRGKGVDCLRTAAEYDPLRLVIPSLQFGLSGPELGQAYWARGIAIEIAGLLHVTMVFSINDNDESIERVVDATLEIARGQGLVGSRAGMGQGASVSRRIRGQSTAARTAQDVAHALVSQPLPEMCLTPRQAMNIRRRRVPLSQAAGLVSAESVYAYPPGSPLLVQGETVPQEFAEMIGVLQRIGVHLQGMVDLSLRNLMVVGD